MRKSSSSSKIGGFLRGSFRRASSGKNLKAKQSRGLSKSNHEKSSKSNLKSLDSKERQGRGRERQTQPGGTNVAHGWRSRSKSRGRSRSKSKSRDSLTNTPTSTSGKNPRLSKSPSRARLEEVMDGIRARERSRSKSRDRRSNGNSSHATEASSARRRSKSREHQTQQPERVQSKSPKMKPEISARSLTLSDDDSNSFSSGWDAHSIRTSLTSGHDSSPTISPSFAKERRHTVVGKPVTRTKSFPSKQKAPLSASTPKKSKSITSTSSVGPPQRSDDPNVWFSAINSRDWILVEELLNSYDHKKFRKGDSRETKQKKKLRVFKYMASSETKHAEAHELESPLLQTDSKGRTPLHLGCKELMPWRLLQSIFFVERNVAAMLDDDGRLPIHHALIANHDKKILDRLIRAHPNGLLLPDALNRTPMGYAIMRAEHKRDKTFHVSWRIPMTKQESSWQLAQDDNWGSAKFLLDSLVARRTLLSKVHERSLLVEAAEYRAPPTVMNPMLSVSARILQQDQGMVLQFFHLLFRFDYPLSIFQKALKICAETVPLVTLIRYVQEGMIQHFSEGCKKLYRENLQRELSFKSELLQAYLRKQHGHELRIHAAVQEWWDKLRFFIFYVCFGSLKGTLMDEAYTLHTALRIPHVSASLIEFLVRLLPHARYTEDPETRSMPVHLACKYWDHSKEEQGSEKASQILNLLVAGDFSLAKKRCRGRCPLHLAILAGKDWSFLNSLVSLNPTVIDFVDPVTRLFPYQLAAANKTSLTEVARIPMSPPTQGEKVSDCKDNDLNVIFELLRMNPVTLNPMMYCGSGDPTSDLGPTALHILSWCYTFKGGGLNGAIVNEHQLATLRSAISDGKIPDSMARWFKKLRHCIWHVYDQKTAGSRAARVPRRDSYLLHAALWNGGTPPIAIELLLELFPHSVHAPIPKTDIFPIHIAAMASNYSPMPFESVVSLGSVLEMIMLASPDTVDLVSRNRTVLQLAIESGKTWRDIRPVVKQDHRSLLSQNEATGLYPFQEMACIDNFMPSYRWIQSKTFATNWTKQSAGDTGRQLLGYQREYQRSKLSAIYEMLRSEPRALTTSY